MTTTDDFNDPVLSAEQQAAVDSNARALVVVASAGSGKTEVVARRIQRLLLADPESSGRVLALTYTVKAADELRARLDSRLGALARRVDSETIHGFAHNLLRTHGTRIGLPLEPELLARDEDRVELFRSWLRDHGEAEPEDLKGRLAGFDLARAKGERVAGLNDWLQALEDNGALDYPALLARATELLTVASARRQTRRLYTSVVVDEAQNLTRAQYDLLIELASDEGKIAVPMMLVGDDKQSIVSFAGADPRLIRAFTEAFAAERHELHTNFRSATALAAASSKVAAALGHPAGEEAAFAAPGMIAVEAFATEADEGERVAAWVAGLLERGLPQEALGDDENHLLRAEEIAVLSRSAAGLRLVASALTARDIPFALSSTPNEWLTTMAGRIVLETVSLKAAPDHHSTYWEIGRLLGVDLAEESASAVRHAILGSEDKLIRATAGVVDLTDVSELVPFLQAVQVQTGLADAEAANWQTDVLQFATSWAQFDRLTGRSELTWANFKLHCSRAQRGDDLASGVRLLTVHKSQGREYAAVGVVGLNDGQFPDFRATTESALRDELRTFYVAITRPRRVLLLTRAKVRDTRYGPRATQPSRFLSLVTP
ncbi:ATP-dependent helicase [Nocardioides perillae]|uniref:DNA 3'-5' helicase n=1 Tax=Nocardioides perillae TaxID=1119534 RepID=A0A7Y9US63_9ACTN|nr:ATP-dependent helicase [Nocardioides perillae]NYG55289.1 DNA helicase-2/ATP-dependent DNA helicase PcrA [Nocardioides perillae]